MNAPRSISVTADDREGNSRVVSALRAMDDVALFVKRLALGDYRVDDRLLLSSNEGREN